MTIRSIWFAREVYLRRSSIWGERSDVFHGREPDGVGSLGSFADRTVTVGERKDGR